MILCWNPCACFFWSGLKFKAHFPLKAHLFILSKFLFSSRATILLSWIKEKKDMLSRNSIFNPFDKSLIYIKNNNGPSINPPGSTCFNIRPDRDLGHLIKLFVFYLSKSYIKDLVNYHIHHFVLIYKWDPHAKFCQALSICLEKHLFVNWFRYFMSNS